MANARKRDVGERSAQSDGSRTRAKAGAAKRPKRHPQDARHHPRSSKPSPHHASSRRTAHRTSSISQERTRARRAGQHHASRRLVRQERLRRRRSWILQTLIFGFISFVVMVASGIMLAHEQALRRASSTSVAQVSTAILAGCATIPTTLCNQFLQQGEVSQALEAQRLLQTLSLEQKVAQLFVVTPESLLAGYTDETVTSAHDMTRAALQERPVGGIVYFANNLLNPEQTTQMLANTKQYALEACGIPILLDVDEEGGTVSRIGGNEGFDIENVGSMCFVGDTEDPAYAHEVARTIGAYLHDLGFTSDFAPVADVANNPDADTMYWRSFGSDATLVAQMVSAQVEGFKSQSILCCAKHFPGIGAAQGDSHVGSIYTQKTADELAQEELVPFQAAIDAGVPMVMVGHISCPQVTGSDLPASVSPTIMHDMLRERLGFTGVVITDSLSMGAVVDRYGYDRVGVEAFLAGADALLMPADFEAAYQGMLDAVTSGEISQERLNQSAYRFILMKLLAQSEA